MIGSNEILASSREPYELEQHQHQQQLLSNEDSELISITSSIETTSRIDLEASLTPAPQTPIETEATFIIQVGDDDDDDDSDKQENELESPTIESIESSDENESSSEGPALDGDNDTDTNDDNENDNDHDDVEQQNENNELSESSREVDENPLNENKEILIRDPDYNPEAEYLSDPDFHDERPGKKSLYEILEEQRKRRESFRSQQSTSSLRVIDCSNNLTHQADELENSDIIANQPEPEEVISQVEVVETIQIDVDSDDDDDDDADDDEEEDVEEVEEQSEETNKQQPNEATSEIVYEEFTFQLASIESSTPALIAASQSIIQHCDSTSELVSKVTQTTALSNSNQVVTATEDRAEHFVDDESTLADDLGSLVQSNISFCRQNNIPVSHSAKLELDPANHELSKSEKDNSGVEEEEDEDEDSTLRSIEEVSNVQQPSSSAAAAQDRHNSLEDIPDLRQLDQANDLNIVDSETETVDEKEVSQSSSLLLGDFLNEYCQKLVETIQEEAFKQVESIMAQNRSEKIHSLNLMHTFEVKSDIETSSSVVSSDEVAGIPDSSITNQEQNDEEYKKEVCARKIYTSSMYYNDQRDSFPTIEQQVEISRTITKQLQDDDVTEQSPQSGENTQSEEGCSSDSSKKSREYHHHHHHLHHQHQERASLMFRRRKERMRRFTIENAIAESELEHPEESIRLLAAQRKLRRASLEPIPSLLRRSQLAGFNKQLGGTSGTAGEGRRVSIDLGECNQLNRLLTETEYEAPKVKQRAIPTRATTTPFSERKKRLIECQPSDFQQTNKEEEGEEEDALQKTKREDDEPKYRPFLDSSTLKDIQRLRNWSPYGEFNEHDSVSPEICLKIVQDLKSTSVSPIANDETQPKENATNKQQLPQSPLPIAPAAISKGQRLFEKRQLQSSDWIVSGPDDVINEVAEVATDAETKKKAITKEDTSEQLSRASISEETVMVADESSNEQFVAEILPLVSSHKQPKLELATVTKTPSFSTSSWRVIECESPDLLTSRDEADDENDDDVGEKDDDSDNDNDNDADGDELKSKEDYEDDDTLLDEGKEYEVTAQTNLEQQSIGKPEIDEDLEEVDATVEELDKFFFASSIERTNTCQLYQATTLEWRPHVMTPIQLTTETINDTGSSSLMMEQNINTLDHNLESSLVYRSKSPIFAKLRCSNISNPQVQTKSTPLSSDNSKPCIIGRQSNELNSDSNSSVASNYKQSIEQTGRRYRSYYYYPHGSEWITKPDEHFAYKTTKRRESFSGFRNKDSKMWQKENEEPEQQVFVCRKEDKYQQQQQQELTRDWRRPENEILVRASSACPEFRIGGSSSSKKEANAYPHSYMTMTMKNDEESSGAGDLPSSSSCVNGGLRNSVNETFVRGQGSYEFGATDDDSHRRDNDLKLQQHQLATDQNGYDTWRRSAAAAAATSSLAFEKQTPEEVEEAVHHDRPKSAMNSGHRGEVAYGGGGGEQLVVNRTSADQQRRAQSLQRDFFRLDGSLFSHVASKSAEPTTTTREARLLSHAQTSSHSHGQQTCSSTLSYDDSTTTTTTDGLHQSKLKSTQNSLFGRDYPSGQQQHNTAVNHYRHQHDAFPSPSPSPSPFTSLSSSDNWRHHCESQPHNLRYTQVMQQTNCGPPPPPPAVSVSSGVVTFSAGPPTLYIGHSTNLNSRQTEEGVAAAASSLVAQDSCNCPCHLSSCCSQTWQSSSNDLPADRLWLNQKGPTESNFQNSSSASNNNNNNSRENNLNERTVAAAAAAATAEEGSYRIYIKLPKRVNRIVVCRQPQLHFATKINH